STALAQLPSSPSGLAWSPDGRWIAFTMQVAADDRPLATLPKAPKGAEWAAPAKLIDRVTYRVDGAGYLEPGFSQVFVIPAEGGAARQVSRGEHHYSDPVWAADGGSLFVSANLDYDWEYAPLESDLYRLDVDSGALTRLTDRRGPDGQAALSADGRQLAYVGFDDRQLGYQNQQLSVLDLVSGKSRVLSADFDFSIEAPVWDGNRGLWFQYDDHGRTRIGWIAASGGKVRSLADDLGGTAVGRPYGGGSKSAAAGRVAYTRGSEYRPAEVAVLDRNGRARTLTDLNANLLGHRRLGRVEEISVTSSADGRAIQGWLVYPPDFSADKKYPLLLEIHGGPFANYGPRFAPETQLYAAAGYLVLYVNPRGSTSYGAEFANLIHHRYPGQDYDDLQSAVDAVIARGQVDTDNLFVTGGSGGGVLTAWIVGHSDRFRAAVVAKPVINWASFALTADFPAFFTRYWFPGPPWEQEAAYRERSPISYVGKVNTPTLLITGEADLRTPSPEAEQFYQALKLRKIDTAMLRIPGASHDINRRPSQMLTQVLNTIAWFERYRRPAGGPTSEDRK
ncbi:MAG: prolyl oligopeptidase family serine peptidase, partial [Lysobacterales bacterium]